MLAAERHQRILELAEARGSVRVGELARLLDVTHETIRRDLERLDQEGRLIRHHGGALALRRDAGAPAPVEGEAVTLGPETSALAQCALRFFAEGETLYLDGSSTVLELARRIPDLPVTVVTNSLAVLEALAPRRKATLLGLGGILDPATRTFLGPFAEQSLERLTVDKAFLSCHALDPVFGASEVEESVAALKRRALLCARERYLLADHSKFGTRAFAQVAPVTEFTRILTDSEPSELLRKELERRGVRLMLCSV